MPKRSAKKVLATEIAERTGCDHAFAAQTVDVIFESLRASIIEGNRIEIRGFGTFEIKIAKPRRAARNPRTGEIVHVPARRKVTFKPGKAIKEVLNQPVEQ